MASIKEEQIDVSKSIEIKTNGKTVLVNPDNLNEYLDQAIVIDSITTNIKITRRTPHNQYDSNGYFVSTSLNTQDAYNVRMSGDESFASVKSAISKKIVEKVTNSFTFIRNLLKKECAKDGVSTASLGEFDETKPK